MATERQIRHNIRVKTLFREVNERILGLNVELGDGEGFQLLCECGEEACIETITMTVSEYETVRAHPARFIVRPGHQDQDLEIVVVARPDLLVVEKVGAAGEEAVRLDPRKTSAEAAPEL